MPDDLSYAVEDSSDPLLDCLVTLARLNARPVSPESILAGLPLTGSRLTPELFVRAAERAGMAARVVARPLARIPRLVLPAVLLLDSGRDACILTALDGDAAEILLPSAGQDHRRVALAELRKSYTGYAILAHPVQNIDDRAGALDSALRRSWFWGTLLRHKRDYAQVVLASVLINLFILASPLFVMNVYDRVVPNNAIETLWVLAIGVVTVFVFDFVFRMLRAYFVDGVGRRVDVLVSSRIFEHVMGMRLSDRPSSAGSFANNIREFETLREFFTSATLTTLVDLPFSALFLAVIWMLGGPLVLVPLLAIVPVVVLGLILQFPLTRLIKTNFSVAAQKHGVLVEAIDGLETLKGIGGEGVVQRKWEDSVGVVAATGHKAQLLSAAGLNFTLFMQQLVMIAIVIGGVYRIADNLLTLGGLVACTILSGRALMPLAQVAGLLARYQHARMAYQSLSKLMALPVERPAGKTLLRRAALEDNLELAKVVFKYPGAVLPALDGASFKVTKGERVAILGRIGSGKSTVAKLLMGLYHPDSGSLLLDGIDVNQIDPADLRRNTGYVPQDVKLFYGTVRENLVMGNRAASDEAIVRATRIAGVDKFVGRHPAGLDMSVGEQGRSLSGGQRQAVAIARALLGDPGMLVLDEPTSAMDFATEQAFVNALLAVITGRSLVLITHKPTLLPLVERIVVLDAGRVVADGPKDKVLQMLAQAAPAGGKATP